MTEVICRNHSAARIVGFRKTKRAPRQRLTARHPDSEVTSMAYPRAKATLPPENTRALLASLDVSPCAACSADIHAEDIPAARLTADPAHCPSCHLNMPTRLAMGIAALKKREVA